MLAVSQVGDELTVVGTPGDDAIVFNFDGAGEVEVAGDAGSGDFSGVNRIVLRGLAGNERITFEDFPVGNDDAPIRWTIDGGDGTLSLFSNDEISLVGNITNQGELTFLSETIEIYAGSEISTRNFNASGLSQGNSADIRFLAPDDLLGDGPSIKIGDGVRILADANNGFAGGNVVITATAEIDLDFLSATPIFASKEAVASIEIGAAEILARTIDIRTETDTTKFADVTLDPNASQKIIDEHFARLSDPLTTELTFDDPSISMSDASGTTVTFIAGSAALTHTEEPATALTFADAGATIGRSDGSWVDDGFAAGQTIRIEDTEWNDGVYQVAEVSDAVLTLGFGTLLVEELVARIRITETDRITRDIGDWIDDDFVDDQFIAVKDAIGNNGFYQIHSASSSTLVLKDAGKLTNASQTNVQITDTDRIERSTGDWRADRFDSGQLVAVIGSLNNDGFTRVLGATASELFVASAEAFLDETRLGVEVVQSLSGLGDGDVPIRQAPADATTLNFAASEVQLADAANTTLTFEVGMAELVGGGEVRLVEGSGVVRRESGSWLTDGFTVGRQVEIAGTTGSNGLYLVEAVTGNDLTLDATFDGGVEVTITVEETDSILRDVGDWIDDQFAADQWLRVSGTGENDGFVQTSGVTNQRLLFATRGEFTEATASGAMISDTDKITRSDGSWVDDGFTVDQSIFVSDSTSNDSLYSILAIAGNQLVLKEVGKLTAGADLGARVTESVVFPELTFSGGVIAGGGETPTGDTITRSSGSWIADGFQLGMNVVFENADDNDGEFTIGGVTDETLTLFQTGFLFDWVVAPSLTNNTELTFAASDDGDTLTRASGSWIEDGYFLNQVVQVDFSESNNALFRIAEMTDTTLTFAETNQLVAETSRLAIVRGQVDATEILNTLTADAVPLVATGRDGTIVETTVNQVRDLLVQPATQLSALNNIIGVAQGVLSNSESSIEIGAGARLVAAEDINIRAIANSEVSIRSPYLAPPAIPGAASFGIIGDVGFPLAVGVGIATARADAEVASNVEIVAGGSFILTSDVRNDFDVQMQTYSGTLQAAKTLIKHGGKFAGFGPLKALTSKVNPGKIADSLPVKMPAPTATLAYGQAESDSLASIGAGTTITAGSVLVDAENVNNFAVSSTSLILFPEKNLGQGVSTAVSNMSSDAETQVDADIIAADISIGANSTNETNSTDAAVLIQEKIPGTGAAEKFGQGPLEPVGNRFNNTNERLKNQNVLSSSVGPASFGMAAALTVAISENRAEAHVGNGANLRATTGSIDVLATAEDNFTHTAAGNSNAAAQVNLGGALNLGIFENDAKASIGNGAIVVAGDSITIDADAEVPNQVSIDDEFLAMVRAFEDFVYQPPEFDPVIELEAPDVDLESPEFDLEDKTVDFPPPTIDLGNTVSTVNSVQTSLTEQATYATGTATGLLNPLVTFVRGFVEPKNLGLDRNYTSSSSGSANGKTPAGEGKFAFGGSATIQLLDNDAEAWIGDGATVTAGLGDVRVIADAEVQTLNVSGAANLVPFFTDGLISGTESNGVALGGTINGTLYTQNAIAWIGDGAVVTSVAGDVAVEADSRSLIINMAQAGGSAGTIGINGTFATQIMDGTSRAYIEDTAAVSAGRDVNVDADSHSRGINFAYAFTAGDVVGVGLSGAFNDYDIRSEAFVGNHVTSTEFTSIGTVSAGRDVLVQADNQELLITLGFAGAKAEGADTEPSKKESGGALKDLMGNSGLGQQAKDASSIKSGVTIGTSGQVDEATLKDRISQNAKSPGKGKLETLKGAAKDKFSFLPGVGDGDDSAKERTVGIGISGDIVITLSETATRAFIGENQVVIADADRGTPQDDGSGGDVVVIADNESILVGITMALAIGGEGKGAAVAGSAAFNIIDHGTSAFIGDGARVEGTDITVIADADDEHFTLTAGGGGAKSKEEDSVGISGSVAAHYLENDTEATIGENAIIVAANDVLVEGENKTQIMSIAGALTFAGGFGFGAAPELVLIDNDADAVIRSGADVRAGGNVVLSADNQEDVLSLAASLAIGTKKLGVSGAGNLQLILTEANAEIEDNASVFADGTVWVDANDNSRLLGFAGGGAFGEQGGFGAAISGMVIVREVHALIGEDAVVVGLGLGEPLVDPAGSSTARRGVVVEATSEEAIINYSGSGAISEQVAIAGSWAPVIVMTETLAEIGDRAKVNIHPGVDADLGQGVTVRADHDSRLSIGAGSLGVGKDDVGVGAALTSVLMIRDIDARIGSDAEVAAEEHVVVLAAAQDRVLSLASAIGGSGGFAGSGVLNILVVAGFIDAIIDDNAQVTAGGNVIVTTISDTQFLTLAGEVAFGKAQGVGVSVNTIVSLDFSEARIADAATVIAGGNRGTSEVPSGDRESVVQGAEMIDITGVSVSSVSFDDVVSIVVGANVGLNIGATGSLAATVIVDTTRAFIDPGAMINADPELSEVSETQNVRVKASNKSNAIAVAGGFSGAKSTGVGAAIGASILVRIAEADVDQAIINAHDMTVEATADGLFIAGALGAAVAASEGTPPFDSTDDVYDAQAMTTLFEEQTNTQSTTPFAGTGSGAANIIVTTIDATIRQSEIDLTGSLIVDADDVTIAVAGAGAVAVAATNAVGGGGGGAVGASISGNVVTTFLDASIDDSNVAAVGDVSVTAETTPLLISIAIAGSGDGSGSQAGGTIGTGAGAASVNIVLQHVEAAIENNSLIEAGGSVLVSARDDAPGNAPTIIAMSGALTLAGIGGSDAATAVGIGAALNGNNVTSLTSAVIDNATVLADGSLTVTADSEAFIVAASVGVGGTLTGGAAGGATFTAVGSATVNAIVADIQAIVSDSTVASGGDLRVAATDGAIIGAGAGGASVAVGVGAAAGSATALGASAAMNIIVANVDARIADTNVTVGGNMDVLAETNGQIFVGALAGSGAGTGGAGGGNTNGLGGAVAINLITREVHALVENETERRAALVDGDLVVEASDSSQIIAAVGGLTLAISGGAGGGNSNGLGAAIAFNAVSNNALEAAISNVEVRADNVTVAASSDTRIAVATLGLAGGGSAGGGAGTVITVAGSGSANVIVNFVDAAIRDSLVDASGNVEVTASTSAFVGSGAGTLAIAGAGGGGDGSAIAAGASVIATSITHSIDATISASVVDASSVLVQADSTAATYSLAMAGQGAGVGGGGAGSGIGVAAAVVLNSVAGNVTAKITDGSDVEAHDGSVSVLATDLSQVFAVVGQALVGVAVGAGGGNAGGVGAALGVTLIVVDVEAVIEDSNVIAAGDINLLAKYDRPEGIFAWHEIDFVGPDMQMNVMTATIGLAGTGSGGAGEGGGLTLVGSGSSNTLTGSVRAQIIDSTVETPQVLTIGATSAAVIGSGAGGASIAAAGAATGSALAVGASLVLNILDTTIEASIAGSTVVAGHVDLLADSKQDLWAAAVAGAGGGTGGAQGNAISAAGAGVSNVITNSVEALVFDNSSVTTTATTLDADANDLAGLRLYANDSSRLVAVAGALSIGAVGAAQGNALAASGSIGINTVINTISAKIAPGSAIDSAMDVQLEAAGAQELIAAALGLAGSGSGGAGAIAVSLVGSGSMNVVQNDVTASITEASINADGAISLVASDESTLGSGAGGAAVSISAGGGGVQTAVAASLAANAVNNTIKAIIVDSQVEAAGAVSLLASNTASAFAGSVAGAGGGSFGGTGVAIDAAAAGSSNVFVNEVVAEIIGDSSVRSTASGVSVIATDDSEVVAGAGAGSLAIGIGTVGVGVAIGASVAVNSITNTVRAEIGRELFDSSGAPISSTTSVTSFGELIVEADSKGNAIVAALGFAAAGGGGSVGVSVSLAGSAAMNFVDNDVRAAISQGTTSLTSVDATGGPDSRITVIASEHQEISAGAGGVAIAVSGGDVSVAVPLAGSVAINIVTSSIESLIERADVRADLLVMVDATSASEIQSHSLSGSAGLGIGASVGVQVGGAGAAGSSTSDINTTARIELANVLSRSGDVVVQAIDSTSMITAAGGGTIAGAGGFYAGVSVGIGFGVAEQVILNDVEASIVDSTVKAGNDIRVSSQFSASMTAAATGFATGVGIGAFAGVSVTGAGAAAGTLADTSVVATITNSTIEASNDVDVLAHDDSLIGGGAGGAAISVAGGIAGVGVAVGASAVLNGIDGRIDGRIDATIVDSSIISNDVNVTATSDSEIVALGIAGGTAVGVGVGGIAIAGAGVYTFNRIDVDTTVEILGNTQIVTTGSVTVAATDNADIRSAAGAGTIAGSTTASVLVGAAFAQNVIDNDVIAAIRDGVSLRSGADVNILATSSQQIEATANGTTQGLSGAGAFGIVISATGSATLNQIGGSTQALADAVSIDAAENLFIHANHDATIRSLAGVVAVSIAYAGTTAVATVAGAIAYNESDHITTAIARDSVLATSGELEVQASNAVTIDSTSAAGAFAISGGGAVFNAIATAATSKNIIGDTTQAMVVDLSSVSGGPVTVSADDNADIISRAIGGVITISAAPSGGADMGIGAAASVNEISNQLLATIDDSEVSALNIAVFARSISDIQARSVASSIVATVSIASVVFAGGGAGADNSISNTVEALVRDSELTSTQDTSITATNASSIISDVGSNAIAIALGKFTVGASVGVSIAENAISNTTKATVDGGFIETGGNLDITANSNYQSEILAIATSLALSTLATAGAGSEANSNHNSDSFVFVGPTSVLRAGGNVRLRSLGDAKVISESYGAAAAIGLGAAAGTSIARTNVSDTSQTIIESLADVRGTNITVQSINEYDLDAKTIALSGSIIALSVNQAEVDANPTQSVTIAPLATLVAAGGNVLIATNTIIDADADANGGVLAIVGGQFQHAIVNVAPSINTLVEGEVRGRDVTIRANHNRNNANKGATATATSISALLVGGSGSKAEATNSAVVHAEVGGRGNIVATRNFWLTSTGYHNASASDSGDLIAGLAMGSSQSTSLVDAVTSSRMAGSLEVGYFANIESFAFENSTADSTATAGGVLTSSGVNADATLETSNLAIHQGTIRQYFPTDLTAERGVKILADSTSYANAQAHAGDYVSAVSLGSSIATTELAVNVRAELLDNGLFAPEIEGELPLQILAEFNRDASVGEYDSGTLNAATAEASAATGSLLLGSKSVESNINSVVDVFAGIGNGVELNRNTALGDGYLIDAFANHRVKAVSDADVNGALALGSAESDVDVVTNSTASIGNHVVLDFHVFDEFGEVIAEHSLTANATGDTYVRSDVIGGAGKTLGDALDDLFSGNFSFSNLASNLPAILAAGSTYTNSNVSNTAQTVVGDNTQILGGAIDLGSYLITDVDADVEQRSGSVLAASATAIIEVILNPLSQVLIEDSAKIEASSIEITADNWNRKAELYAFAQSNADLAGAFATAATNLRLGLANNDHALVQIRDDVQLTATTILIHAKNRRLIDPDSDEFVSRAVARGSSLAVSTASSRADASGKLDAAIKSGANLLIVAEVLSVEADTDSLEIVRIADSKADTVVSRIIEVAREVTERVCRWLGPFESICDTVTRTVIDLVRVFDTSEERAIKGGSGFTTHDEMLLNGRLALGVGNRNQLLIIDQNGEIDPRSTITATVNQELGHINVGAIKPGGLDAISASFLVPFGQMHGNLVIDSIPYVESVEIINYSDLDLRVNAFRLQPTSEDDPFVEFEFNDEDFSPSQEYGIVEIEKTLDAIADVNIENLGTGDIILRGRRIDIGIPATVSILNTGGGLFMQGDNRRLKVLSAETYALDDKLQQVTLDIKGDIGLPTSPLRFVTETNLSVAPELFVKSGGSVYLDATNDSEQSDRSLFLNVDAEGQINLEFDDISHAFLGLSAANGDVSVYAPNAKLTIEQIIARDGDISIIAGGNIEEGYDIRRFTFNEAFDADGKPVDPWQSQLSLVGNSINLGTGGRIGVALDPLSSSTESIPLKLDTSYSQPGTLGLSSQDSVNILEVAGSLTIAIAHSIGDQTYEVLDSPLEGDDLIIADGANLTFRDGRLTLIGGDGVFVPNSARLSQITGIEIHSDISEIDPDETGAIIRFLNPIIQRADPDSPLVVEIFTGIQNDSIEVAISNAELGVVSGGGFDTVEFDINASTSATAMVIAGSGEMIINDRQGSTPRHYLLDTAWFSGTFSEIVVGSNVIRTLLDTTFATSGSSNTFEIRDFKSGNHTILGGSGENEYQFIVPESIDSHFLIDGSAGTSDRLHITAGEFGVDYLLDDNKFFASGTNVLEISGVESFYLETSPEADEINLSFRTWTPQYLEVRSGPGDDTLNIDNIGPGTAGTDGLWLVRTGNGSDQLSIGSSGGQPYDIDMQNQNDTVSIDADQMDADIRIGGGSATDTLFIDVGDATTEPILEFPDGSFTSAAGHTISYTSFESGGISQAPTVWLGQTEYFVNEGDGSFDVVLSRDGDLSRASTVLLTLPPSTGIASLDLVSVQATFAAGADSATVQVPIVDDSVAEPTELHNLLLIPLANAISFAPESASVEIVDNDVVAISIADASVEELDSGSTYMFFEVTLDRQISQTIFVDYMTENGSADERDFQGTSGTLEFNPGGPLSQAIRVEVFGDMTVELDETFTVLLTSLESAGLRANISRSEAIGTIRNDDIATLGLIENTLAIDYYDNFIFELQLDRDVDQPFSVDYVISWLGEAPIFASLEFAGSAGEMQTIEIATDDYRDIHKVNLLLTSMDTSGRDTQFSSNDSLRINLGGGVAAQYGGVGFRESIEPIELIVSHPSNGLRVENNGAAEFMVSLSRQPTAELRVRVEESFENARAARRNELLLGAQSVLYFDSQNWSVPQPVVFYVDQQQAATTGTISLIPIWNFYDTNISDVTIPVEITRGIDDDGVSLGLESQALNGDGNSDRRPDYIQDSVTSYPTAIGDNVLTVTAEEGHGNRQVLVSDAESLRQLPSHLQFPVGVSTFALEGITDSTATVVLTYNQPIEISTFYLFGVSSVLDGQSVEHWYEFMFDGTTGAEIFDDRIVLHFVDNQRGDSNPAVGFINGGNAVTFGGPALRTDQGSISGVVWNDLNGNGVQETGELGQAGRQVFIDRNGNGILDTEPVKKFSQTSQTEYRYLKTVNQAIPDNGTRTSTRNVNTMAGTILDVDLEMRINHEAPEQLEIYLVSPAGTRVLIAADSDSEVFDGNISFDDSAFRNVAGNGPRSTNLYGFRYRPEGKLSSFIGERSFGDWRLEVSDTSSGSTGELIEWALRIVTTEVAGPTDLPKNFSGENDAISTIPLHRKSGAVRDVSVSINLSTDLWDAPNVAAELISPAGTRVELFSGVTIYRGNNVSRLIFDDQATELFTTSGGDRRGIYKPESPLADLFGEDADGEWKLQLSRDGFPLFLTELVDWSLEVVAAEQSQDGPLPIVDKQTTNSEIFVEGYTGRITDLNVGFDIDHTYVGDLDFTLISPSGTRQQLFSRIGGSGSNFANTILDDESEWLIEDGSAPFDGRYRPTNPLSLFDGEDANGLWAIEIHDNAGFDEGFLKSWSLEIDTAFVSTHEPKPVYEERLISTLSEIEVESLEGTLEDINVEVNFDTEVTFVFDIWLRSPDSQRIQLYNLGESRWYIAGTVFDDDAEKSIASRGRFDPIRGHYRPIDPLSVLDGIDPNGTWTLEINTSPDFASSGRSNLLTDWSIDIVTNRSESFATTNENGEYELPGLSSEPHLVRFIPQEEHILSLPIEQDHVITLAVNQQATDVDFGEFIPPTPAVEDIRINDGSAQRSMVDSLTVSFNTLVEVTEDSFEVRRSDGTVVDFVISTMFDNGHTFVTLDFGQSVADGNYQLTVIKDEVKAGTKVMVDDHVDDFFRFFGDSDGDRDVDFRDFGMFRRTFGRTEEDDLYDQTFDVDLDGDVDFRDFAFFRRNFGKQLEQ